MAASTPFARPSGTSGDARPDPRLADAIGLALSVAALAACLTLVFQGMRAVMDIGGACADGGPYVSAHPCPDGVPAAMLLGIFGLFVTGALVWRYGSRIGQPFESLPFLAWPALFGSLGWNFLEYGLLSPPEGEGIIWSWLIPGVLFEAMAIIPLIGWIGAVAMWRSSGSPRSSPGAVRASTLTGPGQPPRPGGSIRAGTVHPGSASPAAIARRRPQNARQAALGGLAASFGAAAALTAAQARLGGRRAVDGDGQDDLDAGPAAALVDRLEALADLREQGLLEEREYDAAKAAVLRDLDALA